MDFMDLLKSAGGDDSIGELAGAVGLGTSDTNKLIGALAPALMSGLKKNTASDDGLAGLRNALQSGGHERYVDNPKLLRDDATRSDGNKILGHLFGSKDVSRNVAAHAAKETGIDASIIKKALPLLAGLAMGAMSKKSSGGRDLGSSASEGGLGPLGDLIGGGDGFGLDDVMGLARKFFK
ncbi:MAG: DUF937 domain-containing protein [Gammaproteobacteria bacterium]|nr:DUF937 domain-containing protein [Gammaproteobacteria bacterium]MDH3373565.1 DUF937 domain-containing protein [Gammaproteobacteria bacterium]MDH3408685.1 DUF937 domain-containing protein [Gammaproteobacteria bacterium]MDH3553454.1 DUF937 domain-containing protein [Gammaproteobacteria bacterium]